MNRAKITAEQSQAIQDSNGLPVYLVDEAGRDASLAIVRVDLLKALTNDDFKGVKRGQNYFRATRK